MYLKEWICDVHSITGCNFFPQDGLPNLGGGVGSAHESAASDESSGNVIGSEDHELSGYFSF